MGYKIRLLKNTELEACIKIVTDNPVGKKETIELDKTFLCYKPTAKTFELNKDPANQFQQIGAKVPSLQIIHGQWSGLNGDCNCRIYRCSDDQEELTLDNMIMTVCVGDTTQLEFDGQSYCADCELLENKLIFEVDGEMTLWFKLRKRDFESFAGEYATYGAFEDDKRRGPYEQYENLK